MHNNYKWETLPDRMGSDHLPINITLNLNFEKLPFSITHKINHKNVDWKEYETQIENYINNNIQAINNYSLDEKYNFLTNTCTTTVEKLNKKKNKSLLPQTHITYQKIPPC